MSTAKEAIDELQADLFQFVAEKPDRWFIFLSMPSANIIQQFTNGS